MTTFEVLGVTGSSWALVVLGCGAIALSWGVLWWVWSDTPAPARRPSRKPRRVRRRQLRDLELADALDRAGLPVAAAELRALVVDQVERELQDRHP